MSFANSAILHGWSGVVLAYTSVQVPMWVGLARGRAPAAKFLASPMLAVPLTVAAGIGASFLGPVLEGMGATHGGFLQFAVATGVSMAVGYVGGRADAKRQESGKIHQRGSVVTDYEPLRRPATLGLGRDRQITLAGAPIAAADETKHFKMIGTTGTGKSTAIAEILATAIERGDRAVIADPDGGYLKRFYDEKRRDVVLNPFDARSVKWDLFGEIDTRYDVEQLARSLIPDHDGADRSWRAYARTFFSAVTRQAHDAGIRDVGELYRLLVVADTSELRTLVAGTPAQPFLDQHNGRMFDSIRSVTSSAVGALDFIAQQESREFSVRRWVRDESPGVLFIPYKAGQIAALRSPISAWMRLAIFETMNQEETPDERESEQARRLWFVVDELDALGQIDGLKDALARLRKFGGRCILGFQSIAQVSSTYGHGDAHTIVENCGNTLILRCSASEGGGTARFASQLIGEREILRETVSRSRRSTEFLGSESRSEHFSVEPAVMPSQIEQLPDLAGYLKQASDPRWQSVRLAAVRQWRERQPAAPASAAPSRGREEHYRE
jgi:type IV secretory pathway TraG/TraD family ATPase VirD4